MSLQENLQQALEKSKQNIQKMFSADIFFKETEEKEEYLTKLNELKDKINFVYNKNYSELKEITPDSIQSFFENLNQDLKQIKYDLIHENPNIKWLNIPVALLNNAPSYAMDIFLENFNQQEIDNQLSHKKTFSKFLSLKNYWNKFIQPTKQFTISEKTYQSLVEEKAKNIIEEFNLHSIQFIDSKTWQQKFVILQEIYNQIKSSHHKIGLSTENCGLGSLNLVISDDFLSKNEWAGFQSETNNSHSIFINSSAKNMNQTWIHEYTHFLDRVAGKKYNFEHNTSIECLSHIALNAVSHNKEINNDFLQIMAETMSVATSGLRYEEYKQELFARKKLAKEAITINIVLNCFKNPKNWDNLSEEVQNRLLENPILKDLSEKILNNSFSIDNDLFFIKSFYNTLLKEDISDINEQKLIDHLSDHINKDRKEILNNYKLSHYSDPVNKNDNFFFIEGNFATEVAKKLQEKENSSRSYFDKPLELFARMVESLQQSILNEYEYQQIKDNKKISSIPILNKEERIITCAAIHNIATYIGLKTTQNNLDSLPCMVPEHIDTQIEQFSDNLKFAATNHIISKKEDKESILNNIQNIRQKIFDMQHYPSLKKIKKN